MIRALILLALLFCAGCASDGAPPPAIAAGPNSAAITITRSSSLMYAGAPATIEINGANAASLGVGQSYAGSVMPGRVTLSASAWSAPGRSTFSFTAEAGKSYRFSVSPRGEQMIAGLAGGIVGQAIENGGPFQIGPSN